MHQQLPGQSAAAHKEAITACQLQGQGPASAPGSAAVMSVLVWGEFSNACSGPLPPTTGSMSCLAAQYKQCPAKPSMDKKRRLLSYLVSSGQPAEAVQTMSAH